MFFREYFGFKFDIRTLIWNANLDLLHPKPIGVLKSCMDTWEKTSGELKPAAGTTASASHSGGSGHDRTVESDWRLAEHVRIYKDQFDELVNEVVERRKERKMMEGVGGGSAGVGVGDSASEAAVAVTGSEVHVISSGAFEPALNPASANDLTTNILPFTFSQ